MFRKSRLTGGCRFGVLAMTLMAALSAGPQAYGQQQLKPAKNGGASPAAIVNGSDLAGPRWCPAHPFGVYDMGASQVRFMFAKKRIAPMPSSEMPQWRRVVKFADSLFTRLHLAQRRYFTLLDPGEMLVLKYHDLVYNKQGYIVVYRAADGSFHYTSNDETDPWKKLPLASPQGNFWQANLTHQVHIDIVRPNANEDSQDREIDYQFRMVVGS